ncbi:hypothetical protein ACLOJK_016237 [Asimina triloba]
MATVRSYASIFPSNQLRNPTPGHTHTKWPRSNSILRLPKIQAYSSVAVETKTVSTLSFSFPGIHISSFGISSNSTQADICWGPKRDVVWCRGIASSILTDSNLPANRQGKSGLAQSRSLH